MNKHAIVWSVQVHRTIRVTFCHSLADMEPRTAWLGDMKLRYSEDTKETESCRWPEAIVLRPLTITDPMAR
jgi:hypothetical protein